MSEQQIRLLSFPGTGEPALVLKAKTFVFHDQKSQQLLAQLDRIAPTTVSVLITGETGTGKELAARHIHDCSGRAGPFLAVNCAALSDSLADAELFGHEAGAYTGAAHSRAGWFEAANGGTLFLDEIGDMPLQLQLRLLRVLQERQVVRIGSRKPVSVDVRIIAATNVDLAAAVEAGLFRRDLYYRLNVAAVRLAALRDRPADILPLVNHFIEVYRRRLNRQSAGLTAAAERALQHHSWPGNIRELENVVHVALIMSSTGVVDAEDLRLTAGVPTHAAQPAAGADRDPLAGLGRELHRLFESECADVYVQVERLLVEIAFEHCAGNQVRTAKRLGVSRNVLRAQLKRFGMLGCEEIRATANRDSESHCLS